MSARQRGVALMYALMGLVAMLLAAVALVRSVDTGNLIIGNLGFKQDATVAADRAADQAVGWLANAAAATLYADAAANGYYATSLDALDATGRGSAATRVVVDWDGNNCANAGAFSRCLTPSAELNINGTRGRYVITRLCSDAGDPAGGAISCPRPLAASTSEDDNRTGFDYSKPYSFGQSVASPYYRVVVRTTGGRNTRSFVETIVHF